MLGEMLFCSMKLQKYLEGITPSSAVMQIVNIGFEKARQRSSCNRGSGAYARLVKPVGEFLV